MGPGALGLRWDWLKDCPVPGWQRRFSARDKTFPEQELALQISYLFSFVPSGSLTERSLCLIPPSPFPSCHYSPGEVGIAWAVRLEPDPGSVGQRLLPPGSEAAEVAALRPPPGELAEEQQRLLQELPGPGLGIKAASGPPGGALGRQVRHHPVWSRGQVIPVQILPDPSGRRGIGVSSPAGQHY